MKSSISLIAKIGALSIVAIGLTTTFILGWQVSRRQVPTTQGEIAKSRVFSTEDYEGRMLTWKDLVLIFTSDALRLDLLEELIQKQSEQREGLSDPARYLVGTVALAQQKPEEALRCFSVIDFETAPGELLYQPYRTHQILRPNDANPFMPGLKKAMDRGQLSPLTAARTEANFGQLQDSLESYLKTDPSTWKEYDLDKFARIALHNGLRPDLEQFIAAAITSGRLPASLEGSFKQFSDRIGRTNDVEMTLRRTLKNEISTGTELGKLALESYRNSMKNRAYFLAKRYGTLIERHRLKVPADVSDEVSIMLFLSAAKLQLTTEASRWSQEIKRRFPNPETTEWITQILKDSDPS